MDPFYGFRQSVMGSINRALISGPVRRAEGFLRCSISEFKRHIEKQFSQGMTWENHRQTGWHLDHAIPLAPFRHEILSLSDEGLALLSYLNLQPDWAKKNLGKGDSLPIDWKRRLDEMIHTLSVDACTSVISFPSGGLMGSITEFERTKHYKLRTRGQRSTEVTVPPVWMREFHVSVGDEIVSEIQSDGTLLYMTVEQHKRRLDDQSAGA